MSYEFLLFNYSMLHPSFTLLYLSILWELSQGHGHGRKAFTCFCLTFFFFFSISICSPPFTLVHHFTAVFLSPSYVLLPYILLVLSCSLFSYSNIILSLYSTPFTLSALILLLYSLLVILHQSSSHTASIL